jgi:hypothetical protein
MYEILKKISHRLEDWRTYCQENYLFCDLPPEMMRLVHQNKKAEPRSHEAFEEPDATRPQGR